MRAYLFYDSDPDSQQATAALAEELAKLKIEAVNLDATSLSGTPTAELYDITRRPSAVVVREDGSMVRRWLGLLPAASVISYYVNPI